MNHLPGLLRRCAAASFLLVACGYAACSILADLEYGIGLKTREIRYFEAAAQLFPLQRTRRSGAAYMAILSMDQSKIATVKRAIRYDPNAADLWYGLARMQLKAGDE